MSTLGPRLATLAGLVRRGSRLADVGTDHAALPVALVQAGVCPRAIASDVRTGPLAAARRAVAAAGLQEKIELRLGDGLAVLAPGEAEDIVIAGMGGETIADILQGAPWLRGAVPSPYRLLLQPMSRPETLRDYLMTNGYAIEEEQVVREGDHLYTVLCAVFTGAACAANDLTVHVGGIDPSSGADAADYLDKVRRRLLRRAEGLQAAERDADAPEIERLRTLAAQIAAYTEKGGTRT